MTKGKSAFDEELKAHIAFGASLLIRNLQKADVDELFPHRWI